MHSPAHRRQIPLERLRFLAERIHTLGPRPLYELFREIDNGADLSERLERYAGLFAYGDFIVANNGNRLCPPRVLQRGRR